MRKIILCCISSLFLVGVSAPQSAAVTDEHSTDDTTQFAAIKTNDAQLEVAEVAKLKTAHEVVSHPAVNLYRYSLMIERRALHHARSRIGDPYEWGAAGPDAFDCSGLVVWAYAQLGISEPHYTGSLWIKGTHPKHLKKGDLLFFYDIGHVGIYVGHDRMLDAPDYGQDVQIQRIYWNEYDGAVMLWFRPHRK